MTDRSKYYHDSFYDESKLSLDKKLEIIEYAHKHNTKEWVDKLNCYESFARQSTDMTYEEVMEYFDNKSIMRILYRRGFEWQKDDDDIFKDCWHGEVMFRADATIKTEYFLWIHMTKDDFYKMCDKFDLKEKW